ncbi:MAG: hypothetical protein PHH77_03165 [Victivallaceae bacterium]|nr:hypothetical protein [Victivallaceae bacterium]
MNSMVKKAFSVAFALTVSSSVVAGFWDSLLPYQGPKKDVITLFVTANYKHPLMIAQLIQAETKQPYLLLPAARAEGIFFNPPRKRSEAALEIREANLARFIRFLNPKQIVILGDTRYVPEKYRQMIDKDIPVITVTGSNWQRIADRLSFLLAACNVGKDYQRLGQQLDSGLYKPTAPEIKDQTPAVEPAEAVAAPEAGADKKTDAPAVKEPEPVLPKSTPELVKDK